MKISLFGSIFNGLEFVTYILIPSAMVLMVLVYIYFNIRIIIVTLKLDGSTLADLDNVEVNLKLYAESLNQGAKKGVVEVGGGIVKAVAKRKITLKPKTNQIVEHKEEEEKVIARPKTLSSLSKKKSA